MKKFIPIVFAIIFVLSGLGAGAFPAKQINLKTTNTEEYDMVIIAPIEFSDTIQPLIDHKNSHGIQTVLKTIEDIYDTYEGRDEAEQIKYFIKNAIEEWGIEYVMLVGGMKSYFLGKPRDTVNLGVSGWHLPVRYTYVWEPSNPNFLDPGFISDLYYADVYKWNNDTQEYEFDDWDSNGNDIFAEWDMRNPSASKDIIDFHPDVFLGRLACRNAKELENVINKIITYETSTYGEEWFNKIVLAGGDDQKISDYNDGEVTCDHIYERYMKEFDAVKLYASYKQTKPRYVPRPINILREFSKGCGFMLIVTHGSPMGCMTFWPDEDESFTCWKILHIPFLQNKNKLPIMVLGGCHCSQFNVSITPNMTAIQAGECTPKCMGWWLVSKRNGGAIATLGFTSAGYVEPYENGDIDGDGINDPDYVEARAGYLYSSFFKAIDSGSDTVGEAWGSSIDSFLTTWPINENEFEDWRDVTNIEAWVLLGDPSLKIGGYP